MTTPSDVIDDPAIYVNRALDFVGRSDLCIGDIEEGTEAAKVALRQYFPILKQLQRAAPWNFCRAQVPLTLLADATGQTSGVSTFVQAPWAFAYAWPNDCLKVRFLPWNTVPMGASPPLMTGIGNPALNSIRLVPAPFLVGMDANYPVVTDIPPSWPQVPQWWANQGQGPTIRTVILTNVPPQPQGDSPTIYPSLVYTALVQYTSMWDELFKEALVHCLAERFATSLIKNRRDALATAAQRESSAKQMIAQARLTNGNESSFPQNVDHYPDWMRVRAMGGGTGWNTGVGYGSGYGGFPSYYSGWDSYAFSGSGSVF